MTHYCGMGNHPTMELKKETQDELTFEANRRGPLKNQPHMHSLDLKLIDENSFEQKWAVNQGGKEGSDSILKLHRAG